MLEVGIVGAGIAGLSAAIALSRAGHRVELFEKSRFTYETGAAITAGVNGTRILSHWDFDFDKAGAVDCTHITRVRADTLKLDSRTSFRHVQPTYGNRWCFFHRADLHAGLRALTEVDPKVKTHLGAGVADVDVDQGIIRLDSGTETKKDLIIVADGAHSNFISKFVGRPCPVKKSPLSLYRFFVPVEQMAGYEETGEFFQNCDHGFVAFYKAEPGRPGHLLNTYPCRSGTLIYCGVMHPLKSEERDLEGWISPANIEDVLTEVKEFHPSVQSVCRDAKDVKVYTNMWREPLETFIRGKAILIGDACHLVLSHHAQGASMALEDAMALEVIFTNVSKPDEVYQSAEAWNKLRLPRVRAAQTMANKMKPGPGTQDAMLDEVRRYYDGPIPGPHATTFSQEYNDFFFSYDVAEEARKLKE